MLMGWEAWGVITSRMLSSRLSHPFGALLVLRQLHAGRIRGTSA